MVYINYYSDIYKIYLIIYWRIINMYNEMNHIIYDALDK